MQPTYPLLACPALIPLSNKPVNHLRASHPYQTSQISPYLQQQNAVTPQENKNEKKGQHNIKHQKKDK
jgi:hypothetical protein